MQKSKESDLTGDKNQDQIASEISHRTHRAATFMAIYLLVVAVVGGVLTRGEFTFAALMQTGQDHLALWALALTPLLVIVWGQYQSVSLYRKIVRQLGHGKNQAVENTGAKVSSNTDVPSTTNDSAKHRIELSPLLKSCVDQFTPSAEQKGIRVSMQVHRNVAPHLMGQQQQLHKVLTSLLDNAVKYTETGSVSLNVKMLEQFRGDVLLRFEVVDTGRGINREQQARLFISSNNEPDDNHLTLSEIKHVVESLGGGIGVYSQPDQGTTIWFTTILQKRQSDEHRIIPGIESSAA
ncbi:MAG: hypothetical protein BMS9Abin33_0783 [Gammaproteobacteria bacterium]|nr:MAG: hypothetical protein BMS9Abin33_0783 [Gammaproteobacteria bacterium]